jgi:hypothetical protein
LWLLFLLKESIRLGFNMNFAGRILMAEELEKSHKNVPVDRRESDFYATPTVLMVCIAGDLIATPTAQVDGKIKDSSAGWLNMGEELASLGSSEMV